MSVDCLNALLTVIYETAQIQSSELNQVKDPVMLRVWSENASVNVGFIETAIEES